MDYPFSLVQSWQQQLVANLEQLGAIRSSAVREAFCVIPRHKFLPSYYEKQKTMLQWKKRSAPVSDNRTDVNAWLEAMYTNRARTILLDEQQVPISSSSQPSIMAHMLEALQVQPGERILEIGTGTGYNSGLLAYLTGDPARVTTIDINASLVQHARQVIDEVVGPGLVACVGDGYLGVPKGAPYDRIIATARAATLPDAWIEQLAPGGKLVMDLGGYLTGGLLVAQKVSVDLMQGHFLPLNTDFMLMQSPSLRSSSAAFRDLAQREPDDTLEVEDFLPEVFRERAFRFFLQWGFPTAVLEWWGKDHATLLPAFFDQATETLLTFAHEPDSSRWTVQVRGPAPLWQQVFQAFQDWEHLERPSSPDYCLLIESSKPYQKRLMVTGKQEKKARLSFLLA